MQEQYRRLVTLKNEPDVKLWRSFLYVIFDSYLECDFTRLYSHWPTVYTYITAHNWAVP